jgi:oligogalacturonide lyase
MRSRTRRDRHSRRAFLASLAVASRAAETNARGRVLPSVAVPYADPATEFTVVRLTDPQFTSSLSAIGNRGLTVRQLLYASDSDGKTQAFRMDLKSKESRQLTDAENLDAASIALLPNERGFWHFDGPGLIETSFPALKPRAVYKVPQGFDKLPGASYSDDGRNAAFIEKNSSVHRLRLLHTQTGEAVTLVESAEHLSEPLLRPRDASLIYRSRGELWSIRFNGKENRRLPLAEGETPQAQWTADGHAVEYLNRPVDPRKLTALREWTPGAGGGQGVDAKITDTSQFVRFAANADASVYIGASGSKASPYLLLLIRSARRELAVAEHRASDPALVAPAFSPNSQFVVFVSDRHGKPAIYSIAVDKLVAETDGGW